MSSGKFHPRDDEEGLYPPKAKKRGIHGEEEEGEMDKSADRGKSSFSSGECIKSSSSSCKSDSFSGTREGSQFTESESDTEESDGSGSGSESDPEPEPEYLPRDCFETDGKFDTEKYYDIVFNLTRNRGGFSNMLGAMERDRKTFRMFSDMMNTAIEAYNEKNDACYKAGKILNCVCLGTGGLSYFLTFNAKDRNTGTENVFQTYVFHSAGHNFSVRFCRIGEGTGGGLMTNAFEEV